MKLLSRLLITIGLTLVAAGRKLDKPAPPVSELTITLPPRWYRPAPVRPFYSNWFMFPAMATG